MGKGEGRDSWAHHWLEKDVREGISTCNFVAEDGTSRCGVKISSRYVNVLAEHIRRHGVRKETSTPPTRNQRTIAEAFKLMCPALTAEQEWHICFAIHGMTARTLTCPLFRKLSGTNFNRHTFPDVLQSICDLLTTAAWKHMRKVTLGLGKRYLAFVAVCNGRALFHSLVAEETFTIPVVKAATVKVINALKEKKVTVVSVVADNAMILLPGKVDGSVLMHFAYLIKQKQIETLTSASFLHQNPRNNEPKRPEKGKIFA